MTNHENKAGGLMGKLAEVQAAMEAIEKTHVAEKLGYKYRSIEDVMTAIHELFSKYKIVMMPIEYDTRCIGTVTRQYQDSVKTLPILEARIKLTLTDAETGESTHGVAYGTAIVEDDKAAGKAISYALKYFLATITTCPYDDMPDTDKHPEDAKPVPMPKHIKKAPAEKDSKAEQQPAKPEKKDARKLTDEEVTVILRALDALGIDQAEVAKTYGTPENWTTVTREQLRELVRAKKQKAGG